jgi:hypothetical protein
MDRKYMEVGADPDPSDAGMDDEMLAKSRSGMKVKPYLQLELADLEAFLPCVIT